MKATAPQCRVQHAHNTGNISATASLGVARLCGQSGLSHVATTPAPLTSTQPMAACSHFQPSRTSIVASAGVKEGGAQRTSKRMQQLQQLALELDDGWGVQPVSPAPANPPSTSQGSEGKAGPAAPRPARLGRKAMQASRSTEAPTPPPTQPPVSAPPPAKKKGKPRSPFVDLQSEAGAMGMAMLSARLQRGQAANLTPEEVEAMKSKVAEIKAAKAAAGGKGGSMLLRNTAQAAAAKLEEQKQQRKKRVVYVDEDDNIIGEEEDEAEDVTDKPVFSLTVGENETEFAEYDAQGNVVKKSVTAVDSTADGQLLEDEEEDEWDFSGSAAQGSGWGAIGAVAASRAAAKEAADEEEEVDAVTGAPRSAREIEALLGGEGAAGSGSLLWGRERDEEQQEWGLEEIKDSSSKSLMEELGVVKSRRGKQQQKDRQKSAREEVEELSGTLLGEGATVQWGGSGLSAPGGADLELQEKLLSRMFKPHKVKELLAHQQEAYKSSLDLKRQGSTRGKFGDEARLHKQLRIVAGKAANKKLLSSQGSQTRPMMEKVRAAIFNMILSQAGSTTDLPPNSRWLDLFAGTGSVGLEALSRGASICHFVEFDPWVCRNILGSNITNCGFQKQSVVHSFKAEVFLRRAKELPRFAGGAFDFISMCPPYLLVSYPELFSLLEGSSLLHENTIMFVEYPKQLSHEVPERVGNLEKVRDRKYGRTWIAVYAPPSAGGLSFAREEEMDLGDELEL